MNVIMCVCVCACAGVCVCVCLHAGLPCIWGTFLCCYCCLKAHQVDQPLPMCNLHSIKIGKRFLHVPAGPLFALTGPPPCYYGFHQGSCYALQKHTACTIHICPCFWRKHFYTPLTIYKEQWLTSFTTVFFLIHNALCKLRNYT